MSTSKANETPKKPRKARNKVSEENQEVSENAEKYHESVKSDEKQAETHENPRRYTPEQRESMMEEIIDRVSNGEPMRAICREENMPAWRTVYDWLEADSILSARFARAREKGEDAIAQECLDIADNAANDWMEYYDKEGESLGWKLNGEHVQRSKLRIETRLKLLAKWNPKKYGDRIQHANDPDNPLIANLSEEDLGRRIAQLEFKIKGGK